MFVPDLSLERGAGHSQRMHGYNLHLRLILCSALLAGLAGCAASAKSSGAQSFRPWVEGGQTGALLPSCGLTAAARAGDAIPGGDSGIVVNLDQCVGAATADLELFDAEGTMVEFDREPLPGGAVLLRPRMPLPAGAYVVRIAGQQMQSIVGSEPEMLPTTLGTLERVGSRCGANFELMLDDAVLAYLPQLKLSVRVDGGPEQKWFDYGALSVEEGSAQLSLRDCFPSCLSDGSHRLEVTAELAGELGTLEPLPLEFATDCSTNAQPIANTNGFGCGALGPAYGPGLDPALLASSSWALAVWLALRRKRARKGRAFG
jgi:hypothetical protein